MWRSAVQVCLGLRIAVRQCGPKADVSLPGTTYFIYEGGLAQLARQRFESVILHLGRKINRVGLEIFDILTHKTVSNEDFVFRN